MWLATCPNSTCRWDRTASGRVSAELYALAHSSEYGFESDHRTQVVALVDEPETPRDSPGRLPVHPQESFAWHEGGSMAPEVADAPERSREGISLLLAAIENLELNLKQCRLQITQIQRGLEEQGFSEVPEIAMADEELAAATSLQEKAEEKLRQLVEAVSNHAKGVADPRR